MASRTREGGREGEREREREVSVYPTVCNGVKLKLMQSAKISSFYQCSLFTALVQFIKASNIKCTQKLVDSN